MKITLQTFYCELTKKYIQQFALNDVEFYESVSSADNRKDAIQERNGLVIILNTMEYANSEGIKGEIAECIVEREIKNYFS